MLAAAGTGVAAIEVCGRVVVVDSDGAGAMTAGGEAAHVTGGASNVVEDSAGRGAGNAAEGAVPAT
jgi:hypothetical protein